MKPVSYTVVESHTDGFEAIKLMDEPFAGIVYTYGNISTTEDEESGTISINFEYEILDKAGKDFGSLEPFEQYIGDVLQEIIHRAVQEHQLSVMEKEQSE